MASVVSLPGSEKPNSYLTLALLSFMFCNFITGSFAIYLSYSSDRWYRYGNLDRARARGNLSKIVSILTFLLGIGCFITIAVMMMKHPIPSFCSGPCWSGMYDEKYDLVEIWTEKVAGVRNSCILCKISFHCSDKFVLDRPFSNC